MPRLKQYGDLMGRYVVWIQGLYYLLNGLWPLLSISAFQAVTGSKTDLWLVNTIGLLLMVTGLVLTMAAYRGRVDLQIAVLGIGTALSLAAVELVYVFKGTISTIYLLDMVIEILFVVGWAVGQAPRRNIGT